MDWRASLGRPVGAEDQPPGYYRHRTGKRTEKGPWQPVRLLLTDDGWWHCLVLGRGVSMSPQRDPQIIPFVRTWGPFHPISEAEYLSLLAQYDAAPPGSPLHQPDQAVDLRGAPAL